MEKLSEIGNLYYSCLMIRFLLVGVFIVILLPSCHVGPSSVPSGPRIVENNFPDRLDLYSHYLYVPKFAQGQERYPLLVILHGAGGTRKLVNHRSLYNTPLQALAAPLSQGELPGKGDYEELDEIISESFVLVPVTPRSWDPDTLNRLIDYVFETYPLDPEALYVSGWSMGGWGTWDYASAYPDKVAAIVPICGGNRASSKLKNKSIWIFHDFADPVVRAKSSQERIIKQMAGLEGNPGSFLQLSSYPFGGGNDSQASETFQTLNLDNWEIGNWQEGTDMTRGSIRYTVTNMSSHVIWGEVYRDENLWEWLYSRKSE